jgi:uncharacterized caspase-like protein
MRSRALKLQVLYFAGHGVELSGKNYVIPVDAKLESERDAPDEAVSLDRLVEVVDAASRLRLIIIDACRDNPFINMKRQRIVAESSVSRGLGRVSPVNTETLIAYAAKAGTTASDGNRGHSPFTNAILTHLPVPGLDIRLAFGRVRDEVMKVTGVRAKSPMCLGRWVEV